VNTLHQTGATRAGTSNLDFFSFATGVPAAHGLTVVPATVDAIAAATPSTGGAGGQVADSIADLRDATDGPDAVWNKYVVALGTASRAATSRSTLADQAAAGAVANLQSEAGVDIDEETISLMTYQHAYQGAARVMTAVDEMLDTLINRMGLVGR
jgi:flagellar hook-associated protein 1 FlgK